LDDDEEVKMLDDPKNNRSKPMLPRLEDPDDFFSVRIFVLPEVSVTPESPLKKLDVSTFPEILYAVKLTPSPINTTQYCGSSRYGVRSYRHSNRKRKSDKKKKRIHKGRYE
jgi:hypothetical protein